jgi:hypothetical protein
LTDEQRARRRRQALDWLRADLQQHGRDLDKPAPPTRAVTVQGLQHWLDDADVKGVRDNRYMANLRTEEREAWLRLWGDVRELLERAKSDK